MKRLYVVLLVLAGAAVFVCGCETGKGLAKGVATTAYYTGAGLAQDTYTGYRHTANFLERVDGWIKENLW